MLYFGVSNNIWCFTRATEEFSPNTGQNSYRYFYIRKSTEKHTQKHCKTQHNSYCESGQRTSPEIEVWVRGVGKRAILVGILMYDDVMNMLKVNDAYEDLVHASLLIHSFSTHFIRHPF